MRKPLIICFIILSSALLLAANPPAPDILVANNTLSTGLNLGELLSGVLAVYETVVRIVPTVKNYSIVTKVFGWLFKASRWLNVKK